MAFYLLFGTGRLRSLVFVEYRLVCAQSSREIYTFPSGVFPWTDFESGRLTFRGYYSCIKETSNVPPEVSLQTNISNTIQLPELAETNEDYSIIDDSLLTIELTDLDGIGELGDRHLLAETFVPDLVHQWNNHQDDSSDGDSLIMEFDMSMEEGAFFR